RLPLHIPRAYATEPWVFGFSQSRLCASSLEAKVMFEANNPQRHFHSTLLILAILVSLAFLAAPSAFAQGTGSATLRGTVKDPKGAVVPSATVTVINERTKDERKTTTNDEGVYVFSALTPGNYTLKVEAQGFKTAEQSGVAVETNSTRGFDIGMQIGQPTETVTITAGAEQLQTETGARENTITSSQINNLSIVSRSAVELLRILPGLVAPDDTALEQTGFLAG